MKTAPDNILDMADEEFAELPIPSNEEPVEAEESSPGSAEETEQPEETSEAPVGETEDEEEDAPETEEDDEPVDPRPEPAQPAAPAEEETSETEEEDDSNDEQEPSSQVDYEAFYKQVMAPFKANGKMIELKSPDEVIALMQMGANYTKKMQALQHTRKFVVMLENNDLLDENKLSFLIDLEKKNPEAIKKLLKDAEIDPMDLDTSEEPNYQTGSHRVSDQEAALNAAIEDLREAPNGEETLNLVKTWDQASKEIVWEHPEVLEAIHSQRQDGTYAFIVAEMERLKTIGKIAPTAPFLHAYKQTGDMLAAQQRPPQPATQAPPPVGRAPVARKAAGSKKAPDNRKVRAAAPPRSSTSRAQPTRNILAMSDEEFLKINNLADRI